mmetsp:Transcript_33655/g.77651  ORF Transcript_33655/g.77651 Transcript_33655/m.77651 type:complete len:212 (+) Transcript_33655:68-703(+)|eukprot:CAMPEP_0116850326 /NCGR_PEP_ID=MMETSP0418-20121206/16093_1 /TAXON_ID=1158023 /ORGANISM="Astrosyne radiata, Strain 13vi08-1A" /LENGTH=211 /DNA_ID=CAMNT_0004482201 /DNA_START=57 /DNA_END=692 /DNA_ORIENTATION=-
MLEVPVPPETKERVISVVCNDKLYVFGRRPREPSCAGECFDLTTGDCQVLPMMPEPREGFCVAVLEDAIYVCGGWDGESVYYSRVDIFSNTSRTWYRGPDMLHKRRGATAIEVSGVILVAGGNNEPNRSLQSAEIFNGRTKKWSQVGDMNTPREGSTSVAMGDGRVMVIGGRQRTGTPPHERENEEAEASRRQLASARNDVVFEEEKHPQE